MASYWLDWVNLLLRWAHAIVGIAWIGASFYFIWLDNHLESVARQQDRDEGVSGELWAVHGGGFYHAQKYQVAPPSLPPRLHWFKWEAYWTFITG
ncbi:MAG: urate hydroxylase PuuD, partial [Burkholderiales bacterium]